MYSNPLVMCGENPPIILTLYISVLGDLLCQPVTSHLREYIYLTCHTSILQFLRYLPVKLVGLLQLAVLEGGVPLLLLLLQQLGFLNINKSSLMFMII
jgi:hypothetical protein